ncbi:N-acetylneuraminate synthase family protein [Aestuariirhabdus sp. Z084]|nr:N-acetylneuraminate synthase family protein [Aestuariirhabdus haliotis]MCL6419597.1 N-acetylneuraminate synthase family protein [Aestuariirhabdus haliotis]
MSTKAEICVSGRMIGYHYDPVVIVEIGINHKGSLSVAKSMVDTAIAAGAEIIKHQTHVVSDEMSELARETIPGNATKSIYDIMDECSLSERQEKELMDYTVSQGAIFISTPFSRAAADRLERFDVPAYKIGSGECNNYPLIEHIAQFDKPVILSTGMNDLTSVSKAVDIFRKYNTPFALLHTTNLYPTPPELVRLAAMSDLEKNFPDAVIGLSDHTTDNLACFGAVALGASILERHYTDTMERDGPDIVCSMDPAALEELIRGSKILKLERGGSKNVLLEEEQVTRDFAFSTVVAIKNIESGDILTKDNIWVKRPGVGDIQAECFEQLLGKKAKRKIHNDEHLGWDDFE